MSKPTKCVVCGSEDIVNLGITVEDGLLGDWYAHEGWGCIECKKTWSYSAEIIEYDVNYSNFEVVESAS